MALEVGAAYVSIVPSFKGFGTELGKQLRKQTSGVGEDTGRKIGESLSSGLGKAGAKTQQFGKTLTTSVTLPIAGIAGASFKAFAGFDQTMRQAGAALGTTGKGMDNLNDLALKMGADTSFSAGQAADAILELAKGGMTQAQIEGGGLKETLTLAAAGGLELGSAATYMSNSLNAFGIGARDSGKVAAALAGGANASTASVESLGSALSQVGPGAVNAGLSLNDTVGALALFDQYGIKGSDAGTSLKTMLTRLVPQTDQAAKAMKKFGLDFTDANGNILPMAKVADQLKGKLGGLSQAQRTTALNTIFGSDASRAASVFMRAGSKELKTYTKATRDKSAAEKMAKTNTEGAAGSMEQMQGSLETAGIVIGKTLAPHVTKLAKQITELVNKFTALSPETQATILKAAGLAAALGPVAVVTGKVTSGLGKTISGATKTASAMKRATTSAIAFGQGIRKPASGMSAFASGSQKAGAKVGSFARTLGSGMLKGVTGLGKVLGVVTKASWAFTASLLANPIVLIGVAIVALIAGLVLLYKKWTPFRELVDTVFGALKRFASFIGTAVVAGMKKMASAVGDGISKTVKFFKELPGKVASGAKALVNKAKDLGRKALDGLVNAVKTGITKTVNFFKDLPGRVWNGAKALDAKCKELAGRAILSLVSKVTDGIGRVVNFFRELPGKVWNAAVSLTTKVGELGRNAMTKIVDAVKTGVSNVVTKAKELPGKVKSGLANIGSTLTQLGKDMILGFIGGVADMAGALVDKVKNVIGGAISAAKNVLKSHSPSRVFIEIGQNTVDGFIEGLKQSTKDARDAMADLIYAIERDTQSTIDSGLLTKVQLNARKKELASLKDRYSKLKNEERKQAAQRMAQLKREIAQRSELSKKEVAGLKANRDATIAIIRDTFNTKLEAKRKELDGIVASLESATQALEDLKSARASLSDSVSGAFAEGRNLFGDSFGALFETTVKDATTGEEVTQSIIPDPQAILNRLNQNLSAATNFRSQLDGLLAKGYSSEVVAQIAAQGQQAGGAMAASLLNASGAQVQQMNSTWAAIGTTATAAGERIAGQMYDAGIAIGQGVVNGLESQRETLQATVNSIAGDLVKAIKKRLKIKSPSQVMASEVGEPIGQGVIGGLESQQTAMNSAMSSFVSVPKTGARLSTAITSPGTQGDSAVPADVRVFIGERELTDIVRVEVDGHNVKTTRKLTHGRRL